MMKARKRFMFVLALLSTMTLGAWAQVGLGNIPKTVKASDARITDIGVMASDMMLWKVENEGSGKMDTVVTTESYILWKSNGDLEEQAEKHRAQADAIKEKFRAQVMAQSGSRRVTPIDQKGVFMKGITAEFHYNVFVYEYPSIDANGKPVTLSAIAGCPLKDADEVEDVVIGTHITITSDGERPSAQTKGFDSADWGVLLSMAAGKKMKLGEEVNRGFGIGSALTLVTFTAVGVVGLIAWGITGITAEIMTGFNAYNNNLVIIPDYEGYGSTKDRAHPYLYQELTARQVVDGVRYGIALYKNDAGLNDIRHPIRENFRSVTCGYSQGGSVSLATHRFIEQNGLTEELHFVGSLCGDGPYDPMATLMYYMQQFSEDHKPMSMPVVLPLIVKGMLDSNPYMTGHRADDFFNKKFLETGIMDWLSSKNYSTGGIDRNFVKCYKEGKNGDVNYFHDIIDINGSSPVISIDHIMNEQCYQYFLKIYEENKATFTQKDGIPLPTKRGVMEDLHLALASNDMTKGWTPQHAILMYHSTADTTVPYVNATSAKNSLGSWVVLHTEKKGFDHGESGVDFFKGDLADVALNFSLRIFRAKRKLCELEWNNQQAGSIEEW